MIKLTVSEGKTKLCYCYLKTTLIKKNMLYSSWKLHLINISISFASHSYLREILWFFASENSKSNSYQKHFQQE